MDSRFFLYLVTAFFVIDAVVIVVRGLKTSAEFNRYLETNYPAEYHRMVFQDAFKRVFHITWHKDSLPYFIFFSTEDFNDPRITVYKGKLRWSFYGFLLNGIAAAVSFAIFGIWLQFK
jgi:hypothetical protein